MRLSLIFLSMILINGSIKAQEIVYTQQKDNNDNIIVMNYLDGKSKQITSHKRKDSSPQISPDGKWMVFTSERQGWWKIWLMDLRSEKIKQLTFSSAAEYAPNWSPDGNHIVFTSERDGNQEIYLMSRDGSSLRNITHSKEAEVMPFWGKDNYIYFSREIDKVYQILRCDPDGNNVELLTKDEGDKLMPQPSNDGKQILYYGNLHGNLEVYLLTLDTQKNQRLTEHPLMDIRPRWSPGNDRIVFERGNKNDNHHVFIMDRDGKNVHQLTVMHYNYAPSFVPHATTLLE